MHLSTAYEGHETSGMYPQWMFEAFWVRVKSQLTTVYQYGFEPSSDHGFQLMPFKIWAYKSAGNGVMVDP